MSRRRWGFGTHLPPSPQFQQLADLFAAHPRTVTLFSQGVNQSTSGTDKANAIINLHLATGRIGTPGAAPFSITGQPNAMGGREVGGLASTLAAHMGFGDTERDRVQRFWQSPTIAPGPGLKAVDMFDAVADGRIKAIWIMATNPAVSMPNASAVRAALAACPFVVVSDCIAETDTMALAHVKLPALGWGEKDGTVTNSERRVSRQRAFMAPPGEAKPDWWAMAELARRMGFGEAFGFANAASIFREFAAQTGFENAGTRVLDMSSKAEISDSDYAELAPFQWGGGSPFHHQRYATKTGKSRLIPVKTASGLAPPSEYIYRLNTGRYRDQWHSMTRTGLSPRLSQHRREPLVEVHPDALAEVPGLTDGGLARVLTPYGSSIFRVSASAGQRRRELFVPIHWTDQTSGGGRTGLLPGPQCDPHSGQPGFKNTPANIMAYEPEWCGFVVSRDLSAPPDCAYWTRIRTAHGTLTELAGDGDPAAMLALLPKGEMAEMRDTKRGVIRAAILADGQLIAAIFLAKSAALPPRDWLAAQLGGAMAPVSELLAGRPATPQPDRGAIVCVCFDIGVNAIISAIRTRSLTSVAAVGAAISAGSNCGSCRPAIAQILADVAP